ncbi:aspartic peptidase domain-containing protein [Xylaria sp. CBS 124048]|nr:aspartic peptidase domain-containing protein [Xylaria sp. CBS 124048]
MISISKPSPSLILFSPTSNAKMIFNFLLALLAIGIASGTAAAAHNGGYSLRFPLRRSSQSSSSTTVEARGEPGYGPHRVRANITQNRYLSPYTVELVIGSPPQIVYPAIDLFANNLWLNPNCDASFAPEACCANGEYNPNNSVSAGPEDCSHPWDFDSPYGTASGCTVTDDVKFAGADLGTVEIGVATESWGQIAGHLGLGFGCSGTGDLNILDKLKSQGLIASRQFSIALGSANPSTFSLDDSADLGLGELLFSGINTRKFAGELRKLDSHAGDEGDPRYYVTITAVGISDPNNCRLSDIVTPPRHAFFDFTTIVSYVPGAFMDDIIEFFPDGFYNSTEGVYQVPCFHRTQDASIDFYFSSLAIRVPMRDFILEVDGTCYLGVLQGSTEDEVIFGQSFLRGAYTAFDMDAEAIYLAQYENCGDQLIDWDPSGAQQEGLCAAKPITLPASCTSTSIASSTSTSSSLAIRPTTTVSAETLTTRSTSTSHSTTNALTASSTTSASPSTSTSSTQHLSTSSRPSSRTTSATSISSSISDENVSTESSTASSASSTSSSTSPRTSSTESSTTTSAIRPTTSTAERFTASSTPSSTPRLTTRSRTGSSGGSTNPTIISTRNSTSPTRSSTISALESLTNDPIQRSTTRLSTNSSTSTAARFTTSSRTTSSGEITTPGSTPSPTDISTQSRFDTSITSLTPSISPKTTSSRRTTSSKSLHRSSKLSGTGPQTSRFLSSGLVTAGTGTGGGGSISGGTSTFWTQPTTGVSWSNSSFTAGSTGRFTPKPTLSLPLTATTGSNSSESLTLTSVPPSGKRNPSQTPAAPSDEGHAHDVREPDPGPGSDSANENEITTVTVTIALLTSTVFMPSPINVPVKTCHCPAIIGTISYTSSPAFSPAASPTPCHPRTVYHTRTLTVTQCSTTTESGPTVIPVTMAPPDLLFAPEEVMLAGARCPPTTEFRTKTVTVKHCSSTAEQSVSVTLPA